MGLAVGVEQMGKGGLLGAGGKGDRGREGLRAERPLRLGHAGRGLARHRPHAGRVRAGGHGVRVRARRRRLRAVRQGRREEPRALDAQPARALPEGVHARRGDGRRDDVATRTRCSCAARTPTAPAAVVLVSEEKLRTLSKEQQRRAVKIIGVGAHDRPVDRARAVQPDVNTLTRNAAKKAYEIAGVDPQDLDLVELHDCFATAELIHYDNLQLCEPGEAGKFIDERGPWRDGKIPVNVVGRPALEGPPARRDRHRQRLRGRDAPARRGGRPPDRGRQGRPDPRDRPRLGLRRAHPGEVRPLEVSTGSG